jgi:hypothetical protein
MIAMQNMTSIVKNSSADDGEEYGANAHVKHFLVFFLVGPLHENKSENYGLKRNFVLLGHYREIHRFEDKY